MFSDKDFQDLLQATSMLRKEQEQEAKYIEKQHEQRNALEYCEQNLFNTKHRIMEMKKNASENTSAEKMLDILKREVNKNKELANEILGREL